MISTWEKESAPEARTQLIEKGDSSISYKIFETKQVLKDFNKIKGKIHLKLKAKLDNYVYPQLRKEPHFGNNIKKLVDWLPETWRYRIGDNRMFYEIDEKEKVVFILTFDPRESAYKQ